MIRPPRPAPIVAAAVLLIVVGSELILAAVGGGLWLFTRSGMLICVDFTVLLAVLLFVVAVHFLSTGIEVLKGTLEVPHRASNLVLAFGVIVSLLSLATMCCCVRELFTLRQLGLPRFTIERVWLLAGLLTLWANSAAVVTAGFLLRNNAQRYLNWRLATHRAPEDDGYQLEGES